MHDGRQPVSAWLVGHLRLIQLFLFYLCILNYHINLDCVQVEIYLYLNDDILVAGDILAPPLTAVLRHEVAHAALALKHALIQQVPLRVCR